MDLEQIRELVKILEHSSLLEMKIKEGDFKITLSRQGQLGQVEGAAPALAPVALQGQEDTEEDYVTSPIVGTFYSAAGPDIPAFARVGDKLKAGETICIVEAMKLMNEITVDFDCEVETVLVSNEQKVEYGQPLFRIRKI